METNRNKKRKPDPSALKRNLERIRKYRFTTRRHNSWNVNLLKKYLAFDKKKDGEYQHTDIQVAEKFERSIPSIQYLRRKRNILLKKGYNPKHSEFINLLAQSEKIIRTIKRKK